MDPVVVARVVAQASAWISPGAAEAIVLREGDAGVVWLAGLGRVLGQVARAHELTLGAPLTGGAMNAVVGATSRSGADVVVKVGVNRVELEREVGALDAWEGAALADGRPVRGPHIVGRGPGYMILERVAPGVSVRKGPRGSFAWELEQAAQVLGYVGAPGCAVAAKLPVVDRWLWSRLDDVETACRSSSAAVELLGGPLARARVALASVDLTGDAVLHGDLLGGNILLSQGRDGARRWVVLDPRPMMGDRVFDVAFLAVMRSEGLDAVRWLAHLPAAAARAGVVVDVERVRTVAQVVAAERLLVAFVHGYFDARRRRHLVDLTWPG